MPTNSTITIQRGASLSFTATFRRKDGSPYDLTGLPVTVEDAVPSVLGTGTTVTVTDAANGVVQFFVPESASEQLNRGTDNKFRIVVDTGVETNLKTPRLTIQVRE